MADDRELAQRAATLGSPTQQRDQMLGTWQATTGRPCSPQQSTESNDAFMNRSNAYDYAKKNNP